MPGSARLAASVVLGRLLTKFGLWLTTSSPTETFPAAADADASLPPDVQAARAAFRLPLRGRYERPATLDQKRALEKHGGRDYDLIESLGCEQADLLLGHLEREDQFRLRQVQRDAARRQRTRLFTAAFVGLAVVDLAIVVLIFSQGGTLISQDSVVLEPRHARALIASTTPTTAVPAPSVAPTPPRTAAFRTDEGYSRAAALARYPALAVPGSALNARYVARYQAWRSVRDPRLDRSNWPEVLAYDCLSSPSPH